MKNHFTHWFPLLLLVLLAALSYWLEGTLGFLGQHTNAPMRHDPDFIVENFSTTRMGPDGTPFYILYADKMMHYPDDDTTLLTNPRFSRVEHGKSPLQITARQGKLSPNGKDIYLHHHVRVVREPFDGRQQITVTTSYLHIIPDKDLAMTRKPVTIRGANSVITAVGLQLNNKTQVLKLFSDVKGRFESAKS